MKKKLRNSKPFNYDKDKTLILIKSKLKRKLKRKDRQTDRKKVQEDISSLILWIIINSSIENAFSILKEKSFLHKKNKKENKPCKWKLWGKSWYAHKVVNSRNKIKSIQN